MNEQTQHFYEFGEYRIEREERLLKRGYEVVSLPPKAVELLFVLLESGGRVLTKDELMSLVWADSFVEESNLTQNIFLLRKVLGGGKNGDGKFIETIPRRGYRFVANVRQANGEVLIAREQTLTRIVVEEEIEIEDGPQKIIEAEILPAVASLQLIEKPERKWTWKAGLLAVAGLILIGGAAFGIFRFSGSQSQSALPPMRVIPVTSYPDYEYEPSLSPDGRLVAFSWSGGEPDAAKRAFNIYVKQPDIGETLQLTRKEGRSGSPVFSPDGRYIAYAHTPTNSPKSELIVIPALGGAERKLYEAVDLLSPRWSPDGKFIVFGARPDLHTPRRTYTIAIDTPEVKQLTAPLSGEGDAYAAVSPDGSKLAFSRIEDMTAEIYIMDLAGGEPRRLTNDNRNISGLAWTNDGKEIVFASNRGGNSFMLWRIAAEGGEPSALVGIGDGAYLPSISRGGNRLAFHRVQADSNIWRVSANGETNGEIARAATKIIASTQRDDASALSPDGRQIAFSSTQSGTREIWLADADGANLRQLTTIGGGYVSHPAWSPDGKFIAFDARPGGKSIVYIVSVESGAIRPLTSDEANSIAPNWSADGGSIYYGADRGEGWQIWKTSAAGGEAVQITQSGGYEACESSDGKYLYYNKVGYFTIGLFRQPISGGEEVKVFDFIQLGSIGDWALTDKGVYFFHRYDERDKSVSQPSINFFDFADGQITLIAPLPKDPWVDPGLSVSPDGKWLYYSTADTFNSDIMLVENFR